MYSSVFREMKKYQKDFSSWCGECKREKMERQSQSVKATKLVNRCFCNSNGLHIFRNTLLLVLRQLLSFKGVSQGCWRGNDLNHI
jgi:hypothetical protein